MTPLVLVHGFMGGAAQWARQASLGAERDIIAVDLPGFGAKADEPPLERMDDFAAAVLDDLNRLGITAFDLLGHSMGGMIVQDIVRLEPARVRKLVLYGTGATGVLPGRFETVATSIARARQDGPHATARRIAATWFLKGSEDPEYKACAAISEKATLNAIIDGLRAMQDWSGEAHLPSISQATQVLWGDADRTYAWPQNATLWKTIPRSHLAVLPNCAHAVHLERSTLFNALIDDFLKHD